MDGTDSIGQLNITFGWAWMNLGFLSGLLMGIKAESFGLNPWKEAPPWLNGYSSVPRRLIRLGHIAFIMLSVINILYGMHIDDAALSLRWKQIGAGLMLFGGIGIPLLCFGAVLIRPVKMLLALPASAVLFANLIIAWGYIMD